MFCAPLGAPRKIYDVLPVSKGFLMCFVTRKWFSNIIFTINLHWENTVVVIYIFFVDSQNLQKKCRQISNRKM